MNPDILSSPLRQFSVSDGLPVGTREGQTTVQGVHGPRNFGKHWYGSPEHNPNNSGASSPTHDEKAFEHISKRHTGIRCHNVECCWNYVRHRIKKRHVFLDHAKNLHWRVLLQGARRGSWLFIPAEQPLIYPSAAARHETRGRYRLTFFSEDLIGKPGSWRNTRKRHRPWNKRQQN